MVRPGGVVRVRACCWRGAACNEYIFAAVIGERLAGEGRSAVIERADGAPGSLSHGLIGVLMPFDQYGTVRD